jgi:Ca-activated chloride channel family protein
MGKRILVLAAGLVLVCAGGSFAIGALYAHRALSNDPYLPLWLSTYDAATTITDQMSVTHVDQSFVNQTGQRCEGILLFPLPQDAIITELALWEDGIRKVGKTMESDTARSIYTTTVRKSIDPALLEYMGNNLFKLSVFPIEATGINSTRRIEITYAELLPYAAGIIEYRFFMKAVNMSSKPVQRASVQLTLAVQQQILSVGSPSHESSAGLAISRLSPTSCTILYGEENTASAKDLVIDYKLKNDDYAISSLTYTPSFPSTNFFDSLGDKPYFLLWITPPDTVAMDKIIKKNVLFMADVSSSMVGTRIDQVRTALNAMVDMLNPGDRFNILSFGTATASFKPDFIDMSSANAAAAHSFINSLGAAGMTNILDAFKSGFRNTWIDTCANTVVFLTDGKPTWPDTNWSAIIDTVARLNATPHVSINTFGIGDTASEIIPAFLKLLAKNNNGSSTLITGGNSISGVLENFMEKISHPTIKNLSIGYGGLVQQDVYPQTLPNVYAQSQLTVLGRYGTAGTFPLAVTGSAGAKTMTLSKAMTFPSASMPNQPFVPRMWASAKINYLLDEIAMYGPVAELKKAVIALGVKYNIITPYTSMIVAPPSTNIVEDKTLAAVDRVMLRQCAPNPFRATTSIRFAVPCLKSPQKMVLKIFDAQGKHIRTLIEELTMGGNFRISWDGADAWGKVVSPGLYLVVLSIGNVQQFTKVKFVR